MKFNLGHSPNSTFSNKAFCKIRYLNLLLVISFFVPTIANSGTLKIGGTGASLGTMSHMAQAYMKEFPGDIVEVLPSMGSGGGIKALIGGAIGVSFSGRPLKEKEIKVGCQQHIYAKSPFVLAISTKNPTSNISLKELVGIYTGKTTQWPDNTPIRLVMRNERESDTKFLKSISQEIASAVELAFKRKGLIFAITDQDAGDKIESKTGAIGPLTLTQILSEKRAIKPLILAGITPSTKNIANETYKFFKTFRMISLTNTSVEAKRFITFVFSETGQKILQENGNLPLGTLVF